MTAIYLTPKRFRTSGTGIDLSNVTDDQLLPVLTVASAMANRYCAAPIGHDFRGGSITDEKHRWDIGNVYKIGTERVYPRHRPIQSVDSLRIDVTNTQHITINQESLYVNSAEGWVEPVALALTGVGLFGFAILPAVGLRKPVANVTYDYGWSLTDESQLASYSGGTLQAEDQFWVESEAVVIKKNGSVLPEAQYDIDYTEGMVTVSSYDSTAVYTAQYVHPLPISIPRATAMIAADILGQQQVIQAGLVGISSLKVEEIEIRQSKTGGLYNQPVNGAAQALLDPFVYYSWG